MFNILNDIEGYISNDFKVEDSIKNRTFIQWGNVFINIMIPLSLSFSIVCIAIAMVLYITSAGNPEKIKTAQSAFLYSIVAALVSLALVVLRGTIYRLLGVEEPL